MTNYQEDIRLLTKIREEYDRQLRNINRIENPKQYDEVKETRNETLEKLFALWYKVKA